MNIEDCLKSIPERIKLLEESLKLGKTEIAEKTGMSKSYIYMVARGDQLPSFDFLIKLCSTFNISADYLLFNQGQMFRENNEFLSNLDEDWLETLKIIESWDINIKIAFMKLVLAGIETVARAQKKIDV